MAFSMTAEVKIANFKALTPHAVRWKSSVEDFSDSCTIKLPSITNLRKDGDTYERVQTGLQFTEGMKVQVYAGYDDDNLLRFEGFLRRVNFTTPVELECEGYSYQLRKKLDFSKSYRNTTVKKILQDVVEGTTIKLSNDIPNIPLAKATFVNVTGIQVLEWLKSKCLLTVYFTYNTLYVGALQLAPAATVKYRLGWNVIKDSELRFNDQKEFADVRIQVGGRKKNGTKEKAFDGKRDGQVKRLRSAITDAETLKKIAEEKRNQLVNRGYEGSITTFLVPFAAPGMAAQIDDERYPERKGTYFITAVEGEFSTSGGRQKVKIGNSLGNGIS